MLTKKDFSIMQIHNLWAMNGHPLSESPASLDNAVFVETFACLNIDKYL